MIYLIILAVLLFSLVLSWWALLFVCFWAGTIIREIHKAAFYSFVSVFLVWSSMSYYYDMRSQGEISFKVASLFGLPSSYFIFPVVGVLGGILGMSFSLLGFYYIRAFPNLGRRFMPKEKS